MNIHHMISSSSLSHHAKTCRVRKLNQTFEKVHQLDITHCFKSRIYQQLEWQQLSHVSWRISQVKKMKKRKLPIVNLREEPVNKISKIKKGTIAGAVALIIGTSIGSGILGLPKKTSPAGLLPTSISMIICWAFLLIEALLLVEINVGLLKKKKKQVDGDELEVISIRTMAQETLGEWGGALATVTYVFLGYTSMIAYSSKSGEILYHFTNLPESVSGFFFTCLFSILVSIGGTRATDQINQWLTVSMIGLLVSIEVLAVQFGGWSGLDGSDGNWEKVPATLPVMIFTLVYHDLAPVLCAYLEGDLKRIRASVLIGSIVPLLALLIWEAIALGLSNQADQVSDPVELLMSLNWSGVSFMVEAFSILAVGTSLIGTLLSFSKFFKEQLDNNLSLDSASAAQFVERSNSSSYYSIISDWWKGKNVNLTATAMVIAPSLVVSSLVPDAFSAATDIAGGYCMVILYGVLPPAMMWAMMMNNNNRRKEEGQQVIQQTTKTSRLGVGLVCVGLFACGIVLEQILHDFSSLNHLHP